MSVCWLDHGKLLFWFDFWIDFWTGSLIWKVEHGPWQIHRFLSKSFWYFTIKVFFFPLYFELPGKMSSASPQCCGEKSINVISCPLNEFHCIWWALWHEFGIKVRLNEMNKLIIIWINNSGIKIEPTIKRNIKSMKCKLTTVCRLCVLCHISYRSGKLNYIIQNCHHYHQPSPVTKWLTIERGFLSISYSDQILDSLYWRTLWLKNVSSLWHCVLN